MTTTAIDTPTGTAATARGQKPLTEGAQSRGTLIGLWAFVVLPFLALFAVVPVAWGGWLNVTDVVIFAVMYVVTGLGITVGYHRYLTHSSFKATRWLRVTLAVAGAMAVQGSPTQWVADHRRHHQYSDLEDDPHSPWRFGNSFKGLTKGMFHAHVGWLFARELSNRKRFAPDLLADKDIAKVDKMFGLLSLTTAFAPAVVGGLVTMSWQGALTAFFWGSLVRVALLHHVTWSINSVCHFFGTRRFEVDDHSTNVFWLAPLSMGEAWHHNHHTFPRSAFHGLKSWEIDPTGWVIRGMRRVKLAWNVVEITPERQREKLAQL